MPHKQPQRILHIPRRFAQQEWGGTESVILNFCRQQRLAGLAPEIHTSRALSRIPRENWRDIPIFRYRYSYPFFGLSAAEKAALDKKGGNLLSLQLFWGLLSRPDVRIYHAHVLKRMGGAVYRAAQLRRRPFVVSLHGNIFDVPKEEADSIVEAQQGHFEWGRPFGMIFGSRKLLEVADAVICVGYSEFEAARASLSHDRVYHLPNGVNIEHFKEEGREAMRCRLGLPPDAVLAGCISRLDPQKNQELLLRSFNRIAPDYPQLHLLISGPATLPAYAEKLQQIAHEGPAPGRVHFMGPVQPESDEHAALFAALDIFVLASRHEPFGIVALEAWAAGKALIASRVGGLQHFVQHGRNGLTIESGNEEELADCLGQMAKSPQLRASLAAAGKAVVQSAYSWKQVVSDLEDIYRKSEERYK